MKKKTQNQAAKRLINHYSAWKYVVLVTTIIILTLSAIPTWYGEQPSIQLQSKDATSVLRNVPELTQLLNKQNIQADEITQQGITPPWFLPTKRSNHKPEMHWMRL